MCFLLKKEYSVKKLYIELLMSLLHALACFIGSHACLCWGDGIGCQEITGPDTHFFLLRAKYVRDSARTPRIYHWKT